MCGHRISGVSVLYSCLKTHNKNKCTSFILLLENTQSEQMYQFCTPAWKHPIKTNVPVLYSCLKTPNQNKCTSFVLLLENTQSEQMYQFCTLAWKHPIRTNVPVCTPAWKHPIRTNVPVCTPAPNIIQSKQMYQFVLLLLISFNQNKCTSLYSCS